MDLMGMAQLMGNFGEFFGAIAVLVTLGYLIIQTSVNTKMLRSGIYSAWVDSRAKGLEMMASHAAEFAEVYANPPKSFRDLTAAEKILHNAFFTHMMNYNEQTYLHHLDGAIDDDIFDTHHRQMINLFRTPLNRETWNWGAHRLDIYDRRFVDYVENEVVPQVSSGRLPEDS